MDAKKSPLALLAQTCSQIGADTGPSKPLLPSADKKKSPVSAPGPDTTARTSPGTKVERPRSAPDTKHILAFKPYETNVLTRRTVDDRPTSKSSADGDDRKSGKSTPSRRSTPHTPPGPIAEGKASPSSSRRSPGGCSPVVRSGYEVLGKEPYKSLHAAGYCCPELLHPAFRTPTLPGYPTPCKDMYCCPGGPGSCPAGCCPKLRPYVCSWVVGDSYCGRSFPGPDDLLQHLRSHAAEAAPPPLATLGPLFRPYPAPLGPLPRYHPYKPYFPPALAPFYSPYLYSQQRPAVHQ